VGVLSAPATSAATIPIDDDHTVSRDTGFAVANTGASDINIKIIFVNPDGTVHLTLTPQELNPLHPGWHVGGFFWQEANDESFSFQGSVVLIEASGNTFSVVALVMNNTLLTAVPVIQGSAPGIH
jgi:hypothetical protein